jgi:hypothetical protein
MRIDQMVINCCFFSRSFLRYLKYVTRNWISWVSFSNKKLMILVNRIPSMRTFPPDRCWKIQRRHSSGLELILKYYYFSIGRLKNDWLISFNLMQPERANTYDKRTCSEKESNIGPERKFYVKLGLVSESMSYSDSRW